MLLLCWEDDNHSKEFEQEFEGGLKGMLMFLVSDALRYASQYN